MDDNEIKISWSFIGKVITFFILPFIMMSAAPFLPSKYSLRTFMIGIVILIGYGAYLLYKYGKKFNEYYKQCDTNKNSIKGHANTISNHKTRIHDNENEINHLKDKLQNEIDERRSSESMIFTSMQSTNYSDSTFTKESSKSIPQSKF